MTLKPRISFILVSFPKDSKIVLDVFALFNKFENVMLGSVNIPDSSNKKSIIGFVVKANTDRLGAITGALGKIPDVKVKSATLPENT
jgi:hypothetical protein